MFQVKQSNLVLTLILAVLNASVLNADYTSSQCKAWYNQNNHPLGMVPAASTAKLLRQEDILSNSKKVLVRRISPVQQPKPIGGGNTSACGASYNSKDVDGVCLWTGTKQHSDKLSAGWISADTKKNCGKKVYIQDAAGQTHYATVLDGCPMSISDVDTGCANIWVTEQLFNKLQGTPRRTDHKLISSWDFDKSNPAF